VRLRQNVWLAWGLVVLVVLVLAAPVLTYPLGRDQGEFATIGAGILRGAVPYVDLWNPKPPAIFYTYAGVIRLFGQSTFAVRALDLLLYVPMAAALFALGRRLSGVWVGLWATGLFGVFYFTETFWTLSQNDGVAALPMTLAVWSVFALQDASTARARLIYAAVAGALAALTLWFKYPYLFFVLALVAGYLIMRRRWVWREVVAFCAGGLLVGLGGMAYLASIGALAAWWQSARVTAGYTAQGYDLGVFLADMRNYAGYRWTHWHVLWVLAIGWFPARFLAYKSGKLPNNRTYTVTDTHRWRMIGVWLMGTAIAMLIQAKGYDYHWLPMLPPLSLLAADTTHRLITLLASWLDTPQQKYYTRIALAIGLALSVWLGVHTWGTAFGYLSGREPAADYHARFVGGEVRADESQAVADYLRQRVAPNDTLYIWGFRPEVYYLTQTRPATRFIFQFPLVADWYPDDWQQQNVDTLWASLPPYVLVLRGDFMPWVTGQDADSNTLLQDYTELNNWLIFNYERETQIGNFLVWKRKA